jgi:hypothetical protein
MPILTTPPAMPTTTGSAIWARPVPLRTLVRLLVPPPGALPPARLLSAVLRRPFARLLSAVLRRPFARP